MKDFSVIDFDLILENYDLKAFGIEDGTAFFCTLFVDNDHVSFDDDMIALKAREEKFLQRHLGMHIAKVINSSKRSGLRSLVLLDNVAQTLERELLAYSRENPHIQLVEINLDTVATTYSNPTLRQILDGFYEKAKNDFMKRMNISTDQELEDLLIDTFDQLDYPDDEFYDFADDEFDNLDDDDEDDKPDHKDNVLKFPHGRLPF